MLTSLVDENRQVKVSRFIFSRMVFRRRLWLIENNTATVSHLVPFPDVDANGGSISGISSLSSRRAVLLHALDTVDALVDVCGDFLSSKVAEDLWPLLKVSARTADSTAAVF